MPINALFKADQQSAVVHPTSIESCGWEMKAMEPLLYVVNNIWVVDGLFWLAVSVSLDFFSLAHTLTG